MYTIYGHVFPDGPFHSSGGGTWPATYGVGGVAPSTRPEWTPDDKAGGTWADDTKAAGTWADDTKSSGTWTDTTECC